MELDRRQAYLLHTMGIELWQRRGRLTTAAATDTDAAADATADTDADATADTSAPAAGLVESQHSRGESRPGQAPPTAPVDAVAAANRQSGLDGIKTEIAGCVRCALHQTRTNTVPGEGSAQAEWLFIGEAPGQNEDRQGRPFVGRAGKLLEAIIAALRMQRQQVYIANVVKCRPPENRDPTAGEVAECEPFLLRQLQLIEPRIIVVLGRIAAQSLLKTTLPLARLRAQVHYYGEQKIPLIVTYHPAYLLRSPEQKARVWEDLCRAQELLHG